MRWIGRQKASRIGVRSGLTLVELVIVILVIGFLMVFVGGILRNLLVPTTEDISAKLSEAFKFGADKAQLTNQTVVFKYDFDTSEYQFFILKREEDGLVEQSILKKTKLPFYSKIIKTRDFSGKVTYQGKLKLLFTPQGTATDLFLYLGSESEIKKTMQIYRYSGKIKVYPGEYILEEKLSDRNKITYGLDERDEQADQNQKNNPPKASR
jgi:general secretion pathway protein H